MKNSDRVRNYEVYLGYACNRACRFCFVEKNDRLSFWKPQPFREICAGILAARKKGFSSLSLLGGEPTLYPELVKLLKVSKKMGYKRIVMFSNGLLLADYFRIRRLTAAGLDSVTLNIPSHRPETFAFLTRHEKGFPLLLRALQNLNRLDIPVAAVCTVNSVNFRELADYASFYALRGVRAFVLQHLKLQGNINPETNPGSLDLDVLKVRMKDCVPAIREMTDRCLSLGAAPPFIEFMPPCLLYGMETRLMEFNRDYEATLGDFLCWHPGSGQERTYEVAYKGRVKFRSCRACIYAGRCRGVDSNYVGVFGGSEFRPVTKVPKPFYSILRGRKLRLASRTFARVMLGGAGL